VDGLPQMLMEAMACGVPVVSTRLVGIPDLVIDGETGLLAKPNDSQDLTDKLRRLIENRQLHSRFSEQGRTFVEHKFDLSNCLNPLFEKFTQSLARNYVQDLNSNHQTTAKGISR